MLTSPAIFPKLIDSIAEIIALNADAVTELDQTLGDGDHVYNLQRGILALQTESAEIAALNWSEAWQKIGMIIMSSVGGASGSLYATLFLSLAKNSRELVLDQPGFAQLFQTAIQAVKARGKAEAGEKTLLDVWIPVADALCQAAAAGKPVSETLQQVCLVAEAGVEATRNMLATKGRASFLGERSIGYPDAGAKTAQLMVAAIAKVFAAD